MKASSATSARVKPAPRRTDPSLGKRQLTPNNAEGFALSGPSELPDPAFNAYRKDLADVALAGRVIASHYAEPLGQTIALPTELKCAPTADSPTIELLSVGDSFDLLDDSLAWSWGYAGQDRRVGYVLSSALGTD